MSSATNALLAVVAAAAMAAAGTISQVFHSNMDTLEFLEHVLNNERNWTPVLGERVKNLGPPPYQDERFKDRLVAGEYLVDGMEYDVRSVVVAVLNGFSGIRSFVDYAGRAMHSALVCHSFRHLAFQAYYVTLLLIKRADAGLVVMEAGRLRENVAVILDKLVVISADLQRVFDLYWETVRLIQSRAPREVRDNTYPDDAKEHVERLHDALVEHMRTNCEPFRWDKQFFDACRIPVTNPLVYDKVMIFEVKVPAIVEIGQAHSRYMSKYFRNLGMETLPRTLWRQIFYYAKNLPTPDRRNETNIHVTAAGARRHALHGHAVQHADGRVLVPAH